MSHIFKIREKSLLVLIPAMFCAVLAAAFLVCLEKPDIYRWYFLLPLGYACFLMLTQLFKSSLRERPVFYMLLGLYFIKFVITPVFTAASGWYTLVPGSWFLQYMPKAVFLSAWELVFLGAGAAVITRCRRRNERTIGFLADHMVRFDAADLLIWAGVAFIAGMVLYYPPLRARFQLLLHIGTNENPVIATRSWRDLFAANGRQVPLGIVDTLMMNVFYIVRVLFPLMLLEKIYLKSWKESKKVLVSAMVSLAAIQITTEANADTIFTGICLFFVILTAYPEFCRKWGKQVVLAGGVAAAALFFIKVRGSAGDISDRTLLEHLSATLNSYMAGPFNIAAAIAAKKNYTAWMGLEEVLAGLPLIGRMFEGYQTSRIFNEIFWGFAGRTDQLLPAAGQGYLYFGALFSPVISLLFVLLAFWSDRYFLKSASIKEKGFLFLFCLIGSFMIANNLSHCLSYLKRYAPGFLILYMKKYRIGIKI